MASPVFYQINTAVFLYELTQALGHPTTLAQVPDGYWDELLPPGTTHVWLMGVWQRSQFSADQAKGQDWLRQALPDVTDDDVIGSAYSISAYRVDARFGGDEALAAARQQLQARGIKLILDYIPNHVGVDHEWVSSHPGVFLEATAEELVAHPDEFMHVGDRILANGKDPNLPAWSDVLQLNAFSSELRQLTIETLRHVSTMCDGVRCDMAMLLMNDIFMKTWGQRAGDLPEQEFWSTIISAVRESTSSFVFIAEVYWDREAVLLQQGFDYCYDKTLYDLLRDGSAKNVRQHITKVNGYRDGLLHFIENHDEERAASVMSWERHQAAAVIMATLPGARLYHDGQLDGRTTRVPAQIQRRQIEQKSYSVTAFYQKLLSVTSVLKGDWLPLPVRHTGLFGHDDIVAWQWANRLVIVNFGSHKVHGLVRVKTGGHTVLLGSATLVPVREGYRIGLGAWGWVILE